MFRNSIIVVTVALVILLLVSFAYGAPGGADVSDGAQERANETTSGQVTTEGGNVTQVNITGTSLTGRWAGFYGEVSGGLYLGDSTGDAFYRWTVSDFTGAVVYASNGTISDWSSGNIKALDAQYLPSYVTGSATDNYTNTFNFSGSFNSSSLDIASVAYTQTWQNGAQTATFQTYALSTNDNSTLIWAAIVDPDSTSFQGGTNTTDYQLLAPADGGTETYNFYMELP